MVRESAASEPIIEMDAGRLIYSLFFSSHIGKGGLSASTKKQPIDLQAVFQKSNTDSRAIITGETLKITDLAGEAIEIQFGRETLMCPRMFLADGISASGSLNEQEPKMAKRKVLRLLVFVLVIPALAGCANVAETRAEQRPFFQPEYQITSHGRKTLLNRVAELDPGKLHVNVAPDYQKNAPLKIAVLPFADRGSANFVVDKIPLTSRNHQERMVWAWTDAQRLRRSMVGYLSEREFYVQNPIAIDAVLRAHGIDDERSIRANSAPGSELMPSCIERSSIMRHFISVWYRDGR